MNIEEFNLMQSLYKVDHALVTSLMATLSYFDFMQFSWTMRSTYNEYLNRAKIDKDNIDTTYSAIISSIKGDIMITLIHDVDEYNTGYFDPSDNGYDNPEFDKQDYEYLAKQSGLKTVEAH